jgi:hypothetical protein
MTDLQPSQPDVVVSYISQQKCNQRRRPGYHGKHNHNAEPVHNVVIPCSGQLMIGQGRSYSASSEYGDVGTWASIAFSSARIFGLRSQT